MNIIIEKGTLEDLEACMQAIRESSLGEHYFPSEESCKNAVLEGLELGTLYVAKEGVRCAGFAFFMPRGAFHAFPYLHLIAVKKEYRGKGVGKALLEFVEEMVFQDRDKLFLVVSDFNPEAKKFYEHLGFIEVGRIPSLYRKGIDEYNMMKIKE